MESRGISVRKPRLMAGSPFMTRNPQMRRSAARLMRDDRPEAREAYLEIARRIGRDFAKLEAVAALSSLSRPDP